MPGIFGILHSNSALLYVISGAYGHPTPYLEIGYFDNYGKYLDMEVGWSSTINGL